MLNQLPIWGLVLIALGVLATYSIIIRKIAGSVEKYHRLVLTRLMPTNITVDQVVHGDRQARERFSCRQNEMSEVVDNWCDRSPQELDAELYGSSLFDPRIGVLGEAYGLIKLNTDGFDIYLFDWMRLFGKNNEFCDSLQTVAIIRPHVLDVPQFRLQARGADRHNRGADFIEMGWADYCLDSDWDYKAKELFEADRKHNGSRLIELVRNHKQTIEWTGERLITYQRNHCVPPGAIKQFAKTSLDLADELRRAAETVPIYLEEQMAELSAKLSSVGAEQH